MYGARRKFPKEVSTERKFSFLSDFLPVSHRLTRKSVARKNDSSFFRWATALPKPKKRTAIAHGALLLHFYPNQNLVVFRRMEGPMVVLRYRDFT